MKRFIQYLIEATMTTSDALKVLGLTPHFTPDQLKDAYKKAAIANHPDKGGDVAMMQKINVARDVLSTPTSTRPQYTHRDDDDMHDDDFTAPHPQRKTITRPEVFEMFRRSLNADIIERSASGSEIRVPYKNLSKGDTRFLLVIKRQQNNLGYEYVVTKIIQHKRDIGSRVIFRFSNDNDDMVFWESRDSVVWVIKQLKTVLQAKDTAFNRRELEAFLKLYKQTMRKIDKNVE